MPRTLGGMTTRQGGVSLAPQVVDAVTGAHQNLLEAIRSRLFPLQSAGWATKQLQKRNGGRDAGSLKRENAGLREFQQALKKFDLPKGVHQATGPTQLVLRRWMKSHAIG